MKGYHAGKKILEFCVFSMALGYRNVLYFSQTSSTFHKNDSVVCSYVYDVYFFLSYI